MLQNVQDIFSQKEKRGLNNARDIFSLTPGESPECLNVVFDYDAFVGKRLGTSSSNAAKLSSSATSAGYGMFDFGVGSIPQERRLLVAVNSGILYSTNVGRTFTVCETGRTVSINNFAFVKNYVINCNDAYDVPLFWAGSVASHFSALAVNSAPLCKYPDSHQGYMFLLNEQNKKRSIYYTDESDMFSTSAWSNFQLPTVRNDEICGSFHLRTRFYVHTKYRLFNLFFVGGNPDWSYEEIKEWGFVPRTVKKIQIPEAGTEAVIGLDWTKRIRIFDGTNDYIISSNIEKNNNMTSFYLDNLNESALLKCWAENDMKAQKYRLHIPYGTAKDCNYSIVFDYRTGALYPEDDRNYGSGIIAQDTAHGLQMVACTTDGWLHYIDSGNTDSGTAINDKFVSSFLFKDTPSKVNKNQRIELFFSQTSSGTLNFEERNDFSNIWDLNKSFDLVSGLSVTQTSQSIDIRSLTNVYQFKLSSSANKADAWEMNRFDYYQTAKGIGRA